MHDPKEKMMVFAAQKWAGGIGIFGGDPRPAYPFFCKIFEPGEHPPHTERQIELFPGCEYRVFFEDVEGGLTGCYIDDGSVEPFREAGWAEMRSVSDQKAFGEQNGLFTPIVLIPGHVPR
jgi:hypothetical protein